MIENIKHEEPPVPMHMFAAAPAGTCGVKGLKRVNGAIPLTLDKNPVAPAPLKTYSF